MSWSRGSTSGIALGQSTAGAAERADKTECRGRLVIEGLGWSSAAHTARAIMIPSARSLWRKLLRVMPRSWAACQLVPPGVTEHKGEQLPLHRGQRLGVQLS